MWGRSVLNPGRPQTFLSGETLVLYEGCPVGGSRRTVCGPSGRTGVVGESGKSGRCEVGEETLFT